MAIHRMKEIANDREGKQSVILGLIRRPRDGAKTGARPTAQRSWGACWVSFGLGILASVGWAGCCALVLAKSDFLPCRASASLHHSLLRHHKSNKDSFSSRHNHRRPQSLTTTVEARSSQLNLLSTANVSSQAPYSPQQLVRLPSWARCTLPLIMAESRELGTLIVVVGKAVGTTDSS